MKTTLIVLATTLLVSIKSSEGVSPVLIVPGYTGSRLEAKIKGGKCDTNGDWITFWVTKNSTVDCINSVLTLSYDKVANTYNNTAGVEVRVPGFGDTDTVEFLDGNQSVPYFHTLVEYFVAKGYKRGDTIRAAPYDWRLAADSLNRIGYYQSVQKLIEEMSEKGKVNIVVHSMGGPVSLYFLNNVVSQNWKDKYINAFVPLSGAWSGGNGELVTVISAIRSGSEKPLGVSFQTMESSVWLLPNPLVWEDRVIVTTHNKQYSAKDYKQLFDSIDREIVYDKIEQAMAINGNYSSPNVPVYCFYGVGLQTIEVVNYDTGLPDFVESVEYGDGDSSVNTLSSEVCLRWSKQAKPFHVETFAKTSHGEMVTSQAVLDAVNDAIK